MACTTRFTIYSCLLYPFAVRRASTKNPGITPGLLILLSLVSPLPFETLNLPRPRSSYGGQAIILRTRLILTSTLPLRSDPRTEICEGVAWLAQFRAAHLYGGVGRRVAV
jgi:hypothetical protein